VFIKIIPRIQKWLFGTIYITALRADARRYQPPGCFAWEGRRDAAAAANLEAR